jgi:NADH-quinone oxidoreductase subunit M
VSNVPVLSILIGLPVVLSIVLLLIPAKHEDSFRWVALVGTGLILGWMVLIMTFYKPGGGMQFVESHEWVPVIGMKFSLGMDGLSLPLVFLGALLPFLCVIYSWRQDVQPKTFFFLIAMLQIGMIGVFLALDYVLFYIFWEIVLVPMFFLINIWGGERRRYAAVKFFIFTLVGSVVMLLGILMLWFYGPKERTFDILTLARWGQAGHYSGTLGILIFAALFLGFAVKVPIFPFHTWLPDAHVEAPTVGSVLLAGVLLKMGGYGFLRMSLPTLPQAFHAGWGTALAILGVTNIVYGAALALTQKDLKKMVAYSSIGHMGFVVLGIAAGTTAGVEGAAMQMFTHGIITGMLFLLVGMIYERYHTKPAGPGRVRRRVPVFDGRVPGLPVHRGDLRHRHRADGRVLLADAAADRVHAPHAGRADRMRAAVRREAERDGGAHPAHELRALPRRVPAAVPADPQPVRGVHHEGPVEVAA